MSLWPTCSVFVLNRNGHVNTCQSSKLYLLADENVWECLSNGVGGLLLFWISLHFSVSVLHAAEVLLSTVGDLVFCNCLDFTRNLFLEESCQVSLILSAEQADSSAALLHSSVKLEPYMFN